MKDKTKKDLFIAAIFSLSLITAFSLGYFTANLVKIQKPPIVVEKVANDSDYTEESENLQEGEVVASVNSDKFHYLHCSGAARINEENKIYFDSAEEAQEAGFTLAGNCK